MLPLYTIGYSHSNQGTVSSGKVRQPTLHEFTINTCNQHATNMQFDKHCIKDGCLATTLLINLPSLHLTCDIIFPNLLQVLQKHALCIPGWMPKPRQPNKSLLQCSYLRGSGGPMHSSSELHTRSMYCTNYVTLARFMLF